MDASAFDEQTTQLRCRDCGKKTPQRVAWLRKHSKFACPACGTANYVDVKKLLAELVREKEQRESASAPFKAR